MFINTNSLCEYIKDQNMILPSLFFVILITLSMDYVYAEKPSITLIYPQTKSSYMKVVNAMINGMKKNERINLVKYEANDKTTASDIFEVINKRNSDAVISLGSYALDIVNKASLSIPVIAGATLLRSDTKAGISLIGSPVEFIQTLKNIAPDVRHIHVVYNRHNSDWYIKKSVVVAKSQGIKLKMYQADNVSEAAVLYREILNKVDDNKDAIWILMDRVVPQNAILPEILKHAWDKNIVTFSSNPIHVKQGVLFALYPDYEKVGYDLAKLAEEIISSNEVSSIYPVTGMKTSVNTRTASHLGLRISPLQLEKFDSVFPLH